MEQEVSDVAGTTWLAEITGTRSDTCGGSGGEPHVSPSVRASRIVVGADRSGNRGIRRSAWHWAVAAARARSCPTGSVTLHHLRPSGEDPRGG